MTYCSCSLPALPIDVLQQDWWVPGSTARAECAKFQGKDQFREILAPSVETTRVWVQRATQEQSLCQTFAFSQKPQNQVNEILAFIIFSISPPLRGFPTSGGARCISENEGGAATAVKVFQRFPTKKKLVFFSGCFQYPLEMDSVVRGWPLLASLRHHPTLPQKNAQLDDEGQLLLHDVCCLWHWLVPKLQHAFPTPVVEKHTSLFMRGSLGYFFASQLQV